MTDQLISFETAKLAKEKEFNEDMCHCGGFPDCICTDLRPTQSLLQKWLREVHNIEIDVINVTRSVNSKTNLYGAQLYNNITNIWGPHNGERSSISSIYEEALEVGLQEALKLIKV